MIYQQKIIETTTHDEITHIIEKMFYEVTKKNLFKNAITKEMEESFLTTMKETVQYLWPQLVNTLPQDQFIYSYNIEGQLESLGNYHPYNLSLLGFMQYMMNKL